MCASFSIRALFAFVALIGVRAVWISQKIGMPSLLAGYNAKPMLLTKSTTVFTDDPRYVEASTNVAMFQFAFRKVLANYGLPILPKADARIGLVIEGRNDAELPEQMLGCLASRYVPGES